MYCPKCGKENREGARFCSGCGTPLKQAPAPEKQQKQEKKEPRESRQSQEFRKPQEPRRPQNPRKVPESQEDQWVNEVKIQYKDKSLPPLTEAPLLAKKKKEGKKWGAIAVVAVLIAVLAASGAVGMMFFLRSNNTAQSESIPEEPESEEALEESSQAEEGETAEETEASQEEEEKEIPESWAKLENEIPPNSASDDGNLFGNTLCYARMVSDGDNLYWRNPLDNEAIYSLADPLGQGGAIEKVSALDGIYMKDMHFLDGCFYYCKTGKGDVSGLEPDMNLYRVKADGTGLTKLTDISYTGTDGWLSFDGIADGKCYFSYYAGDQLGYRIARVGIDGSGFEELYMIPAAECDGVPNLNLVEGNVYYWKANGLNCLNPESGANALAVGGFKCGDYWIYSGRIYYSAGPAEGESTMKIKSMKLDGTDIKEIFSASSDESWMKLIQANVYRDRLYFIGRSDSEDSQITGHLYSCALDGSDLQVISEQATWFNIVDSVLYYRFDNYADLESGRKEPIYRIYIGDLETQESGETQPEAIFDPSDYNQGWVQQGETWYFYEEGAMAKNTWKEIQGSSYYFGSDGAMYVNTTTPDGYTVGPDGAWQQ